MTTTIQLELPDDVFSTLRRSPREFAREMRFAGVVQKYLILKARRRVSPWPSRSQKVKL